MVREYKLKDIKNWCHELADAVISFEKEFLKKPEAVGYNDNIYNQINLIVNQEKDNVMDVDGKNPTEDDFVELGFVTIGDNTIEIWTCEDFPDDRFSLDSEGPDGDDGEPYYELEEEKEYQWKRIA